MSLQTLQLPSIFLKLLDVLEPLVQLADVTAHIAGEERLDHALSFPEAVVDGSLVPSLEVLKLALLEAVPEPSVNLVYLLWDFLPLAHVKIEDLLLLLSQLDLVSELVLEENVVVAALLEVSLHLLAHLEGFLGELFELLLKDHEPVVDKCLMLTQSLHNAVELLIIALEVVIASRHRPLQAVDLLLQRTHPQPHLRYAKLVLRFLCACRTTDEARCELVSWRSLRTYLMYF